MTPSLASLLTERARTHGDGPALSVGGTTYTWSRLAQVAWRLGERFGRPGLRLGLVAVTCDALPFVIAAALLRDDQLLFVPQPGSADVDLELLPEALAPMLAEAAADESAAKAESPRDPQGAFVFRTSGTEGEPKTVVTPFRHCRRAIDAMVACGALEHARHSTAFISQPLFHSYGLCTFLEYLAVGSHVVLPRGTSPLGPLGDLTDAAIAESITAVEGVPHFWNLAAKLGAKLRTSRLRHIGLGGGRPDERALEQLLARFPDATVSVRYGLTETPSVVSHKIYSPPHRHGWATSGRIVPAYEVQIVDANGHAVPAGTEGEVVVRGECVAAADGVLRTGDLGILSDAGELTITGRRSVFIKYRGYRISPEPIESVLRQQPGIEDCRVRGEGENLLAELVEPVPVNRTELVARLRQSLPLHCVPDRFQTVAAIPRTYSGKIKRSN